MSRLVRAGPRGFPATSGLRQQRRCKHKVRVILTRDLPEGQMREMYAGEVHSVAAGYARNYLVPKKMAVYATPRNFERAGLVDPDIVAKEGAAQQQLQGGDEEDEDLKAADLLRRYLRNKTVKFVRNVDRNMPTMCHPGHVSAKNLRDKLSMQLKIDLEEHETVHILNEPIVGLDEKDGSELMQLIREIEEESAMEKETNSDGDETAKNGSETEETAVRDATADQPRDCDTKVKKLGEYLAKITLAGGYVVPLKFRIDKR